MKFSQLAGVCLSAVVLSVSSPIVLADSKTPDYVVKSFKLLGDEAVSQALTAFSQKNNLTIVSCDTNKAELVCVFQKHS